MEKTELNIDDLKYRLIIKPRRNLLEINFREVWKYRELVFLFVRRDFVAIYKQTILGPLWFLIQPLFTTFIYTIIFARMANISTNGLPPMIFYLTGTIAWSYFSTTLLKTSDTFIQNAGIFGKVYFPRLTVPISIIFTNLIQFAIQFLLLSIIMLYYILFKETQLDLGWNLLLIPFMVLLLALLAFGMGVTISSLTTKYRDLKYLLTFGIQLFMYATPVIYPISEIPPKYQSLILLNPLSSIIETFRFALTGTGFFSINYLIYSIVFCFALLSIGILMFNRVESSFMDTV